MRPLERSTTRKRVLIVGGGGFLGAAYARRRIAAGEIVHVLVKPTTPLDRLRAVAGEIGVHRVRPGDQERLHAAFRESAPNVVIHAASRTRRPPSDDLSDAVLSVREDLEPLLAVLEAAATTPRPPDLFLRLGSLAEYGFGSFAHGETDCERPADAYAAGMLAGTRYMAMLQPRLPFAAMTARLGLVYGPGQSQRFFIPAALHACLAGEPLHVRRPQDARDLIHVDDVLRGLDALSAAPSPGAVVNVGAGVAVPMGDVARLIMRLTGAPPSLLREGPGGPARVLRLRNDLAARRWGWRPRISLEAGLTRMLDALRAEAGVH